jgi:hypothetical protein
MWKSAEWMNTKGKEPTDDHSKAGCEKSIPKHTVFPSVLKIPACLPTAGSWLAIVPVLQLTRIVSRKLLSQLIEKRKEDIRAWVI